jgi:hypothetical protein
MQETRYNDELIQKVYSGKDRADVLAMMDAALRPGEEVLRRRELEAAEVSGINRHERRKNAALARRNR